MKIYHYHKETGEYVGSSDARIDPLETEICGRKTYLVPACATTKPPPESDGKVAVFVGGQWETKELAKRESVCDENDGIERLIKQKMREIAIDALKSEGKWPT